jgi:hypothetical protein
MAGSGSKASFAAGIPEGYPKFAVKLRESAEKK